MKPEETKQLSSELCKRWKGKFNRSDLEYWARELNDYAIPEVIEALTKFRNSSRFVPKPKEILALLPRRIESVTSGMDEGSFADVLRRQNRQYHGRADAEVYLRYYRSLWVTYGAGAGSEGKHQLTRKCAWSLMNAGMPEDQAERATVFIFDSPEMFRLMLDDIRSASAEPVETPF